MTIPLLILRPQPGADETAARARARGFDPVVAPLFTIRPIEWTPPDASGFDAVLLTSANAARRGGLGLAGFLHLPCYAVGEATAESAEEAGFLDVRAGPSDGAALLDLMAADGVKRALHPCGKERRALAHSALTIEDVPVYAADAVGHLPEEAQAALAAGAVAMLHSPRAAALFARLADGWRARTVLAAISPAAATASGVGWRGVNVAPMPRDEALLELAVRLCQRGAGSAGMRASMIDSVDNQGATTRRGGRGAWLVLLAAAFVIGGALTAWVMTLWQDNNPAPRAAVIRPATAPVPPSRAAPALTPTVVTVPGTGPDLGNGLAAEGAPERLLIDPETTRRVDALEQRLAQINLQTRFAAGSADRAEGLLVALAVRRALDRGVGLGYLEGLLRQRFGDAHPQQVGIILFVARNPVTLQELQDELQDVAPQLTGVGPEASWWDALQFEMGNLVTIRREGTPSSDPQERLSRALRRLEAGQVDVALAEVLRLPARERARDWIAKAQRYVAAHQSLDALESAVLSEPAPIPVAPAPQPAAAPVQHPAPAQPGRRAGSAY